ncbi:MAG: hypothetical protein Tsb0013_08050 [Phycisphaerales bacterium]
MHRVIPGIVALGAMACAVQADQFSVRGASIGFISDRGFIQEDVPVLGVNANAFLGFGALWTPATTNPVMNVPGLAGALAGSTFMGGRGGSVTPSDTAIADTGRISNFLALPVGIEGELFPTGMDQDFQIQWVTTGSRLLSSRPGEVNGVSGEYFWMAQIVIASGSQMRVNVALDALINTEDNPGANAPVTADSFLTTEDGHLYAPFERDGETFWWTVYRERTIENRVVYQVYVSDVQVVPTPGVLTLLAPIVLVRRRRRCAHKEGRPSAPSVRCSA